MTENSGYADRNEKTGEAIPRWASCSNGLSVDGFELSKHPNRKPG
jgi:hypothetical protein